MITGKLEKLKKILDFDVYNSIVSFINDAKSGKIEISQWKHFDETHFLKAILLNQSNKQDTIKEYHKAYTDIHITLYGVDTIFIGSNIIEVIEEYQEEKDYSLVNSISVSSQKIVENYFALIKPKEIHCNVLEPDSLKIVIKIKEKCQK